VRTGCAPAAERAFTNVSLVSPAPSSASTPAAASALVPRAPLATVSGTEVRQDPDGRGEYTVFNLCARWAGGSHMLLKRWSECHCLHEALEKELGGLSARALADGASPTQVRGCWPKGLELQRKTKRCSVDDEKRIEKRARQLTAYFRDVGEWAGGEGIDVSTASQAWAEFCAPVDVDGAKRAFEVLDLDDSGEISWVELSLALRHAAVGGGPAEEGGSAAILTAGEVAPKTVDALFNRARAGSGQAELARHDFEALWQSAAAEDRPLVSSLRQYIATKVRNWLAASLS
jgi:hypothetical protein